jgi:hypothetical protein
VIKTMLSYLEHTISGLYQRLESIPQAVHPPFGLIKCSKFTKATVDFRSDRLLVCGLAARLIPTSFEKTPAPALSS